MSTGSTPRGLTARDTALIVYHKTGHNATVLRRSLCDNGHSSTSRDGKATGSASADARAMGHRCPGRSSRAITRLEKLSQVSKVDGEPERDQSQHGYEGRHADDTAQPVDSQASALVGG
jgi:hypothetical protein